MDPTTRKKEFVNLLQKTKNRKHRPQTNLEGTLDKNEESQAPSPNILGDNLFQKRRIASTVSKPIWKEPCSKTKNRKHRPHTNLERTLNKNDESQAPSEILF
jgi:hypothetical protein